ncbi:MAG: molybdopterin-dependent oxidoreductase, partial [Chloroflexota bacterium]
MATEKAVKTVTITLDGQEVSGPPGTTILELSLEAGVHIPTLCYHSSLPSSGACRLCLVEEEKTKALLASCVTPIAPGMVINTKSPRVLERRKTIVELMLSSHPDSCLVCDKGNRCQLRQVASEMGIGCITLQRIPQLAITDDVNPFIERDLAKCILCGKCIRACQELVVEGAIDYFQRGFVTRPATLGNQPLEKSECTFCGTCVALCPTGAITEREKSYRSSTANAVQTTCPFCGCGCGITLEVRDNRLVRAVPTDQSRPLCVRGSYGTDFIHSPERLTQPLVKKEGKFAAVSWDEALTTVAEKLSQIKQQHGGDSLAVLGSSRCTNEESYLLQRFARSLLGTSNIDNGARMYGAAIHFAPAYLSLTGPASNLDTLEQSDVIMVIGADPSSSAPAAGYVIKRAARNKKARLVLVDPRETKLAMFAHQWLRPEASSDVALLNGLMKVIMDEGLIDKESVSQRAANLQSLTKGLESYTPEHVERLTGISPQSLRETARLLAGAQKAAIVFGSGITQQANGTDGVAALVNLAIITGKARLYALERDSNARGASDMGVLPDFLPGYTPVEDAAARARFEECWGVKLSDK